MHAGSCSVPGVSQVPALRFSGLWWVRCRFSQQGALLPTLTVLLGPACVHPFIPSYLCPQNKQLLLKHLITSHGGDRAIPLGAGSRMLSWKTCSDSALLYFGKTVSGVSVRATEFSQNGWDSRRVISQPSGMSHQGEAGGGTSHSLTHKVIFLG